MREFIFYVLSKAMEDRRDDDLGRRGVVLRIKPSLDTY